MPRVTCNGPSVPRQPSSPPWLDLHPLEIGKHVAIAPAAGAHLLPGVVVLGVAAHIDHAVDRRGTANDLAARRHEAAIIEMRLRLRCEAPVVALHVHRIGKGGRHLDQRPPIGAAIFEDEDAVLSVLGKPVCHDGTGRAGSNDDEVVIRHSLSGPIFLFSVAPRSAPQAL